MGERGGAIGREAEVSSVSICSPFWFPRRDFAEQVALRKMKK
jgi:hypothetical protein